jgi:hypothetical protein
MQKWEYLYITRTRGWKKEKLLEGWIKASNWVCTIETATGTQEFPYKYLPEALEKLGDEGWELVSVSPRSSYMGQHTAGFTTDEIWVFKRPKE